MQVRPTDVPDEKRVSRKDEPRRFRTSAPVGDEVGVVCGRMPRGGECTHDRVPEVDHLVVAKWDMLEVDCGASREVRRCPGRLAESREAGDMVRLHVCLENSSDRGGEAFGFLEVGLDEVRMWVEDSELRMRQAAE